MWSDRDDLSEEVSLELMSKMGASVCVCGLMCISEPVQKIRIFLQSKW